MLLVAKDCLAMLRVAKDCLAMLLVAKACLAMEAVVEASSLQVAGQGFSGHDATGVAW